jgi:spore maturation protein SpmA
MLNLIWLGLFLAGLIVAAVTNRFEAVSQGTLNAAKNAVMDLALPLVGVMALWLGMMRLAEKSGLVQLLGRMIRPVMVRLFPDVPPNHPAMGSMIMNMAANMLGVSNAATPLGLKAMHQLNQLNTKPGVATNAMCMFLAINTSSIQLIPTTAINILAINGSANPTAIVGSSLIATTISTAAGIAIAFLLQNSRAFRWERETAIASVEPSPNQNVAEEAGATVDPPAAFEPLRLGGRIALILLGILFLVVFLPRAFPQFFGGSPPRDFLAGMAQFFNALSPLAIPFLLAFFPLFAAARRVPVYTEFVEGAKEGFQIAIRIIPYLVGMLVAIAMFRESGGLQILQSLLDPVLRLLHFPVELVPMVLIRPLSGSGTTAVFTDLVKQLGPDNPITWIGATIFGSTETTFYVIAVYFGAVAVTRTRHAIAAGLFADFAGVVGSILACRLLFGPPA